MALYKNKEESWIKLSIIVDLQCVDLQCTIFWITCLNVYINDIVYSKLLI